MWWIIYLTIFSRDLEGVGCLFVCPFFTLISVRLSLLVTYVYWIRRWRISVGLTFPGRSYNLSSNVYAIPSRFLRSSFQCLRPSVRSLQSQVLLSLGLSVSLVVLTPVVPPHHGTSVSWFRRTLWTCICPFPSSQSQRTRLFRFHKDPILVEVERKLPFEGVQPWWPDRVQFSLTLKYFRRLVYSSIQDLLLVLFFVPSLFKSVILSSTLFDSIWYILILDFLLFSFYHLINDVHNPYLLWVGS